MYIFATSGPNLSILPRVSSRVFQETLEEEALLMSLFPRA
jgi:hypothetical protein